MNVHDKQGRAWEDGEAITDPEQLAAALQNGYEAWINDAYWVIMPFKLLDPGVTLKYAGERAIEDGRPADVLELTFNGVGVTPENRYEVFVAKDTGLVEQWSFYRTADATEPGFTLPWTDWQRFGRILIATKQTGWTKRLCRPTPGNRRVTRTSATMKSTAGSRESRAAVAARSNCCWSTTAAILAPARGGRSVPGSWCAGRPSARLPVPG